MFIHSSNIMFSTFLILGSLMAISSNSWFTAWLGLEINLMSMTPIILTKMNQKLTESAIKYFMIQALSSVTMILSVSINMSSTENFSAQVTELILFFSLLMKSGTPPFHFWLPQMINKLNWTQCFIMFSWQKMAPLLLMNYLVSQNLVMASIISTVTGALGGLNQKKIKIMMAYSSISHAGWLIISSTISFTAWLTYFLMYCLVSLNVIYPVFISKIKFISSMNQTNKMYKYAICMNLLSLGGLPPFLGFSMKLSILVSIIKTSTMLLPLILISTAMVSLYFYCRVIYSNMLSNLTTKNLNSHKIKNNNFILTSSILMNLIMPLFYVLI